MPEIISIPTIAGPPLAEPPLIAADAALMQAREKLDEALCIFDTIDIGPLDDNLQALSEALLMAGVLVQKTAARRFAAGGAPPALQEA
ncbi:hypothetical protein LOC51_00680 [Rubrivivax sp. JA1024]|nr:hypothetical protein [Rubrivivax sp. JA1024]